MKPISKKGVRILRPSEYETLRNAVKPTLQPLLDGLLLTGMRYIEAERFQDDPSWLDSKFVHLPKGSSLKEKARFKERVIRLSSMGEVLIPQFLRGHRLPTRQTWDENLKRWATEAGLEPEGLCAKTTRKTWESWLIYYYPSHALHVVLSQGHTGAVSIEHYVSTPFMEEDRAGMKKWVEGWI